MRLKIAISLVCVSFCAYSQNIYKVFYKDSASSYSISDTLWYNATVPIQFKEAIDLALQYYPQLKKRKITFRVKKSKSPLSARPGLWAVFQKSKNRRYFVTISNSTTNKLTAIQLNNLSFNSQVGVLGHELAHLHYYDSKRGVFFLRLVIMHLSKKAMDRFEFNTDKICIEQGLGFQLLSWSKEVREKLYLNQWGGADNLSSKRERYMNPTTIQSYIDSLPIYHAR